MYFCAIAEKAKQLLFCYYAISLYYAIYYAVNTSGGCWNTMESFGVAGKGIKRSSQSTSNPSNLLENGDRKYVPKSNTYVIPALPGSLDISLSFTAMVQVTFQVMKACCSQPKTHDKV